MITAIRTNGTSVGGNGSHTVTVDLDFPTSWTLVTISISRFGTSGGVVRAGILNYRYRKPDNTEETVNFPGGPNDPFNALPATLSHARMTHVTMQVTTFDAWTRGLCTMFFGS